MFKVGDLVVVNPPAEKEFDEIICKVMEVYPESIKIDNGHGNQLIYPISKIRHLCDATLNYVLEKLNTDSEFRKKTFFVET
jgi:hypothetical protein